MSLLMITHIDFIIDFNMHSFVFILNANFINFFNYFITFMMLFIFNIFYSKTNDKMIIFT
jgi:hypothetical protein